MQSHHIVIACSSLLFKSILDSDIAMIITISSSYDIMKVN